MGENFEKPQSISRREALRLALAAALAAGIKLPSASAAPGYEHLPITEEDERYFEQLLTNQGGALDRFRAHPTREQAIRLVRVLARSKTEWAESVRRQHSQFHAGARVYQATYREGNEERKVPIGNGTVLRVWDASQRRYRFVEVTAAHVAHEAPDLASPWIRHRRGLDLSARELTHEESQNLQRGDALPFSITRRVDMSGKVGVIVGLDRDTGRSERKLYPSRISPRLTRAFFEASGVSNWDIDANLSQADEFRAIILPANEVFENVPGMSGSAWLYLPENSSGVALGGVLLSISRFKVSQNEQYVVGHVADCDQVTEAIEHLFSDDPAARFATRGGQPPYRAEEGRDWRSRIFGQN